MHGSEICALIRLEVCSSSFSSTAIFTNFVNIRPSFNHSHFTVPSFIASETNQEHLAANEIVTLIDIYSSINLPKDS